MDNAKFFFQQHFWLLIVLSVQNGIFGPDVAGVQPTFLLGLLLGEGIINSFVCSLMKAYVRMLVLNPVLCTLRL